MPLSVDRYFTDTDTTCLRSVDIMADISALKPQFVTLEEEMAGLEIFVGESVSKGAG